MRKYVTEIIGGNYLIPLLGVYEKFDDINFESLPNSFVLKCTHDSGSVVICLDKKEFNINDVKRKINKSLKRNFYLQSREWPYKNIKPRIICEKMIDAQIIDYKFFCFNGEPKFLYVGQGLVSDHSLKIDFYSVEWEKMPFKRTDYSSFETNIEKPTCFDEMLTLAGQLSKGIPFVRVDLYEVDKKVYFSEFTFSPGGGHIPINPKNYDKEIGTWLKLPV
ncbi:hypothetical protein D3C76_1124020 [compost metagenome]